MPRSPEQARQVITEAVERIDRELVTAEVPDWAAVAEGAMTIVRVASAQRRIRAAA